MAILRSHFAAVSRAPTEKKITRRQELRVYRRPQEALEAEQRERDRKLFAVYPTEDDLLAARDRAIRQLDAKMELANKEARPELATGFFRAAKVIVR